MALALRARRRRFKNRSRDSFRAIIDRASDGLAGEQARAESGQTLFSRDLVRPFGPRSIESVALCARDDELMRPLLEAHAGCRVVVCPPEVVARVVAQGRGAVDEDASAG